MPRRMKAARSGRRCWPCCARRRADANRQDKQAGRTGRRLRNVTRRAMPLGLYSALDRFSLSLARPQRWRVATLQTRQRIGDANFRAGPPRTDPQRRALLPVPPHAVAMRNLHPSVGTHAIGNVLEVQTHRRVPAQCRNASGTIQHSVAAHSAASISSGQVLPRACTASRQTAVSHIAHSTAPVQHRYRTIYGRCRLHRRALRVARSISCNASCSLMFGLPCATIAGRSHLPAGDASAPNRQSGSGTATQSRPDTPRTIRWKRSRHSAQS